MGSFCPLVRRNKNKWCCIKKGRLSFLLCHFFLSFPRANWMSELSMTDKRWRHERYRLQNSPYFCVFKYMRTVKLKLWSEAENGERDWGETSYGRVGLARFARVRLWPHTKVILRKNRLFCSLRAVQRRFRGEWVYYYFVSTQILLNFILRCPTILLWTRKPRTTLRYQRSQFWWTRSGVQKLQAAFLYCAAVFTDQFQSILRMEYFWTHCYNG